MFYHLFCLCYRKIQVVQSDRLQGIVGQNVCSKSEPPHTTLENEAGWSDEASAAIAFPKWRAVAHQQTFAMRLGRIAFGQLVTTR